MKRHIQKIKTDYHFHPNLPKDETKSIRKINAIYKRFEELGIRVVISTEHVYKDYKRAWVMMSKYKPKNISIFPGLEYTTKENIDICIFSETDKIYQHEFIPFQKTYEEIISFIENDPEIFGFVTHPFTLGRTSIIDKKGRDFTKKMINRLGSVEVTYTVFSELKEILKKTGLSKIMTGLMNQIDKNESLPKEFYPTKISFLAAGSDAHHVWEIGTCATVKTKDEGIFRSITGNRNIFITRGRNSSSAQIVISLATTFQESCLKKLIRAKQWIS